jgi:hypothetical protein
VRIHDLRHSFASFAIADGASLFLVSKLLGHASARTAERFAHLGGDPLQDVAATIGRRLMGEEDMSRAGVGWAPHRQPGGSQRRTAGLTMNAHDFHSLAIETSGAMPIILTG